MKELIGGVMAEGMKMRRTFLYPFHVGASVLGSMLFLLYYRVSGWNEMTQISGYMEVIGIVLPLAVSIVCAGSIGLEEENHFQVFLGGHVKKWKSFWSKLIVLAGIGIFTIMAAVLLFGAGYHLVLGKNGISPGMYIKLILILFAGSIPLYAEHLFLNLMFAGNVSKCTGVAEFLLSALFLTNLGDGRWQFFPCTWSAKGVSVLLNYAVLENNGLREAFLCQVKTSVVICTLLLVFICVIIGIWFHFYEGRRQDD